MFQQHPLLKTGLLAGLLASLLGGWALLARSGAVAPVSAAAPPSAVQASSAQVARALDLELQPVPTLAPLAGPNQPSGSLQSRAPAVRAQVAPAAPAVAQRPLARSRSSR